MASLTTLQGRGGGRIPTNTTSYDLNRHQLTALVRKIAADLYPTKRYSAAINALQSRPDAARLIREAAVAYMTEQ